MHTHTAIDRAFARVLSFASSFSHLTFTFFFVFFGPRNKCRVATGNWLFDIAVRRKEREEEWKIF